MFLNSSCGGGGDDGGGGGGGGGGGVRQGSISSGGNLFMCSMHHSICVHISRLRREALSSFK